LSQENTELFTYFIEYTAPIEGFVPELTEPQFEIAASQIEWVILRLLRQNYNQDITQQSVKKLTSYKVFVQKICKKNSNLKSDEILQKIEAGLKVLNE
jgi:hypothetical protein